MSHPTYTLRLLRFLPDLLSTLATLREDKPDTVLQLRLAPGKLPGDTNLEVYLLHSNHHGPWACYCKETYLSRDAPAFLRALYGTDEARATAAAYMNRTCRLPPLVDEATVLLTPGKEEVLMIYHDMTAPFPANPERQVSTWKQEVALGHGVGYVRHNLGLIPDVVNGRTP